ncbi:hypothetical protein AusDCA_3881 [Desulfitobacterium sp. AusDCA]
MQINDLLIKETKKNLALKTLKKNFKGKWGNKAIRLKSYGLINLKRPVSSSLLPFEDKSTKA